MSPRPRAPAAREVQALATSTREQRRKYTLGALGRFGSLVRIGDERDSVQCESVGGRVFIPMWPHEVFVDLWDVEMREETFADPTNTVQRSGAAELVYEYLPRCARAEVFIGLFPIGNEYADIVDAWELATEIRTEYLL